MIDIKLIRENRELVKENIKKKFQDEKLPLVDEVYELDIKYRENKAKADNLRSEKNTLSAQIGELMRNGKKEEAMSIKDKIAEISTLIPEVEKEELELEEKIRKKAEVLDLYVEFTGKKPFSNFLIFSRANGLDVMDLQINKNKYAKDMVMSVVMTVKSQKKRDKNEVLELIEGFEGILYIEAM